MTRSEHSRAGSSGGGLLERLQRGVALKTPRESSYSFRTEVVKRETASMGAEAVLRVSMGADTKSEHLGGWFERRAAYSSERSVVLAFRPSARAAPPWGPSLLERRLRAWERRRVLRRVNGH